MPEWLTRSFESDVELSLSQLVTRIGLALLLGCVVAAIYRFTHGRDVDQSRGFMATLVLLSILIAMMTLVIGNNVARAFSLVGALAIVRFRTVVEDTRDTAFVIFAVSVGMAVGAGFLKVPLVAIPVAAAAAFLFRPTAAAGARDGTADGSAPFELTVRLAPGSPSAALVEQTVRPHARRLQLVEVSTTRQGALVERRYGGLLAGDADGGAIVEAVHRIEGVVGVELKRR